MPSTLFTESDHRPRFVKSSLCATLVLGLLLVGCGKEEEEPEPSGPQSSQIQLLDSVQKTVEDANARTRKVEKGAESVGSPQGGE